MAATIPLSIAAQAIVIMAGRAAVSLAPILMVAALWWLAREADWIIARLFPHFEWEKSLGWLNIGAERRAKTALRWLGVTIYVLLGAALVGITWETRSMVDEMPGWPEWPVVGDVMMRLGFIVIFLSAWTIYLGGWLLPRIRAEREGAGLREFRARMKAEELEKERRRPRQPVPLVSPIKKPRSNSTFAEELLGRKARRPPGE